jgi:hypothetical protein
VHAQTVHLDRRLLVQKVIMTSTMHFISMHNLKTVNHFKAYPYQAHRSSCQASKGASRRPSS